MIASRLRRVLWALGPSALLTAGGCGACADPPPAAREVEARIWDDARNQGLWSHGRSRQALARSVVRPNPRDRGRVRIADGTVVADNGMPLRGEHMRVASLPYGGSTFLERAYRLDTWRALAEDHHLNAVRLLLYRLPLHGTEHLTECPRERCFDDVEQALPHIDALVEIASETGFYVVIDYHAIGDVREADLAAWWEALAPRYAARTHVLYELCNEPANVAGADYDAEDLRIQEEGYRRIRQRAPESHIILWSFMAPRGDVLGTVRRAPSIDYANASVGYHPYNHDPAQITRLVEAGYPVINTEVGAPSRELYLERTRAAEARGVSWFWLDGSGIDKDWAWLWPLPVTWPRDPATLPDGTP